MAPKELIGKVKLAKAIDALREELTQAIAEAPGRGVRFGLGPIELTVEAAITLTGGANAKINWWLIEAGTDISRESVTTQTLKLTLEPILVRDSPETGKAEVVDFLISDVDKPVQTTGGDNVRPSSHEPE